jgi:hypothetical protein
MLKDRQIIVRSCRETHRQACKSKTDREIPRQAVNHADRQRDSKTSR